MEFLAEIQMLSLALEGDWEGVKKIIAIMKVDDLGHFLATCDALYHKFRCNLRGKQFAAAWSADGAEEGRE